MRRLIDSKKWLFVNRISTVQCCLIWSLTATSSSSTASFFSFAIRPSSIGSFDRHTNNKGSFDSKSNDNNNNKSNDNASQLSKGQARHRRIQELLKLQCSTPSSAHKFSENDSKELKGLLSKGDPYNANLFTDDHSAFKQSHNDALVRLAQYRQPNEEEDDHDAAGTTREARPVFYLDGPDGATTRALLEAGFDRQTELFMANEWQETVEMLRGPPLEHKNCHFGSAHECLTTTFRHVPFVAAYLDGCGGDPAPVIDMITALLSVPRAQNTLFIGFTLTNAEPSGRELIDRVQDVTRSTMQEMKRQGRFHTMIHVGDDPGRFGLDHGLARKHEGTTTCWLACMAAKT